MTFIISHDMVPSKFIVQCPLTVGSRNLEERKREREREKEKEREREGEGGNYILVSTKLLFRNGLGLVERTFRKRETIQLTNQLLHSYDETVLDDVIRHHLL